MVGLAAELSFLVAECLLFWFWLRLKEPNKLASMSSRLTESASFLLSASVRGLTSWRERGREGGRSREREGEREGSGGDGGGGGGGGGGEHLI